MKGSHSARVFRSFCRSSVSLVIVALLASAARAEEFDWRTAGGYNWNTSVKQQWSGTCWAYSEAGQLESHYKLTRNDPNFDINLSEQQLIWETNPDLGENGGGPWTTAFPYFTSHGVVTEEECPMIQTWVGESPYWPLASGWENRVIRSTTYDCDIGLIGTAALKTRLKTQGMFLLNLESSTDMYESVASMVSDYQPMTGGNHAVVVVGFADDANVAGGGYWIIKNSWGTDYGDNGYGYVPFANRPAYDYDVSMATGPVYYTGAMATATWNGGAGTWTESGTNWNSGAYAWENQETAATFGGAGGAVTISGQAIAHSVTINAGSTGYTFSGGGLTVTAGGITANESATINGLVTVGAPQTWTVASGKTLAVNGDLHTVISDLTINGPGTVAVSGSIDGGGVINTIGGAAPGKITVTNGAYLWLDGNGNYLSDINAAAGSHGIAFDQDTGEVGHCYGVLSGSGYIDKYNHAGTVVFHATNTYTNWTSIYGGAVQADSGVGLPAASLLNLNGGVLQSNGTVTFTRSLGTSGSNRFQWNTGGGGFAAGAGAMTVRVNNGTGTLTWGTTVGTNIVGTLKFGSETAGNVVTFQNGINLNAATRTIDVQDNPETGADYAVI
ncbi:MAG TPA: C1 family peptidase, partial [Thermoguttaceae bacterium]|nr:C1 family peptidase [Thermoguttaceae bacterium]